MKTYRHLLLSLGILFWIFVIIMVCRRAFRNRLFHPGYSCCMRCDRTWDVVRGHDTPYDDAHWTVTTPNDTNAIAQVQGTLNDGKTYQVTVTNGVYCFALCENCWKALTPETRLPYYRRLVDERVQMGVTNAENTWPRMKAAVLEGK